MHFQTLRVRSFARQTAVISVQTAVSTKQLVTNIGPCSVTLLSPVVNSRYYHYLKLGKKLNLKRPFAKLLTLHPSHYH
jgi:hypothetical protein